MSVPHADHRAMFLDRLDTLFGAAMVARSRVVRGASEDWTFDAVVERAGRLALFELVPPHAVAVGGAVTKVLDIRDLGDNAPGRIAVLGDKAATPHPRCYRAPPPSSPPTIPTRSWPQRREDGRSAVARGERSETRDPLADARTRRFPDFS
ncbi:hypothetical protein [Rhodoplanes sp. SY1]|uniref:hypothetical protein n=1 Tax=Rhodoplanes sp. SY1 TaxID=3166646 RepID=UPI0038B4BBD7